ncbi:hypothetical protein [Streptomyces luteireticuli]|uniref:DUF3592 domain-containing protein n=1 Tax=Streptomyces luteireticuli TaxID=173858 RepID=A0ABP3IXZ8_9ACTN
MLGWCIYGGAVLFIFGALIYPFGIRPLLIDRRLRSVGVVAMGECLGASWSEDRVAERFLFETESGDVAYYRTPLRDGRVADDGEIVEIIYDPRAPSRRARTKREMAQKSPAYFPLWGGLALFALLHIFFYKLFI